jgi:hypothetical protein
MQVFNLCLGVSRPHADLKMELTLADLEAGSGQELLQQFPLMRQLHVFTHAQEKGETWRVKQNFKIADDLSWDAYHQPDDDRCRSTPSTVLSTKLMNGIPLEAFRGKVCHLRELESRCGPVFSRRTFQLALDLPNPRRALGDDNCHLDLAQSLLG